MSVDLAIAYWRVGIPADLAAEAIVLEIVCTATAPNAVQGKLEAKLASPILSARTPVVSTNTAVQAHANCPARSSLARGIVPRGRLRPVISVVTMEIRVTKQCSAVPRLEERRAENG